jgi:hypothetical protein
MNVKSNSTALERDFSPTQINACCLELAIHLIDLIGGNPRHGRGRKKAPSRVVLILEPFWGGD